MLYYCNICLFMSLLTYEYFANAISSPRYPSYFVDNCNDIDAYMMCSLFTLCNDGDVVIDLCIAAQLHLKLYC